MSRLRYLRSAWSILALRRRIVVVERRAPALGDVLALAACLPALRRRHPRCFIVLICAPDHEALLAQSTAADLVLGYHRPRATQWILSRASQRYSPQLPDEQTPAQPRVALGLAHEFAFALGEPPPAKPVGLRVPASVQQRVDARLRAAGLEGKRFVVIHAGPTWKVKEWPAGHWQALAPRLAALELAAIQIGADVASSGATRASPRLPNALDWIGSLSWLETAALLRHAAAIVGIDSGPLHLAQTLGVPVVGLFGPTRLENILWETPITAAAFAPFDCLGCHHNPAGPQHTRDGCAFEIRCMQWLTADVVARALEQVLQNAGNAGHSPAPPRPIS